MGRLLGAIAGAQEEARRTGHSLVGVEPAVSQETEAAGADACTTGWEKKVPKVPATSQMCFVLWAGIISAYPEKLFSKETHLGSPPPSLTTQFTPCALLGGEPVTPAYPTQLKTAFWVSNSFLPSSVSWPGVLVPLTRGRNSRSWGEIKGSTHSPTSPATASPRAPPHPSPPLRPVLLNGDNLSSPETFRAVGTGDATGI